MAETIDINFPMHQESYRHKLPQAYHVGGHRGRYSDSSMYDDVCVLCGRTDSERGYYDENCSRAVSDDVAQAARDADPAKKDKPSETTCAGHDTHDIPGNEWIANAPGQGVGGLPLGMVTGRQSLVDPPLSQEPRSGTPTRSVIDAYLAELRLQMTVRADLLQTRGAVSGFSSDHSRSHGEVVEGLVRELIEALAEGRPLPTIVQKPEG